MNLRSVLLGITLLASATASANFPENFFDAGPAPQFLDVSVQAMAGGSSIIHNYKTCFPEIENLNTNMGLLLGVGARATFGIRGFLGLTTEANVFCRNYNIDLSVVGTETSSMSGVFINNRAYVLNFPVLLTFRFNLGRRVRWNVDVGGYYSYGFAGTQKQQIYVGKINELGQLVAQRVEIKSDYFNSHSTFQNSFRRGDIGFHLGTSIDVGPHLRVGARMQVGIKNVSYTRGVVNPAVRNIDLNGLIGWRF